jgi:hypothetical protein
MPMGTVAAIKDGKRCCFDSALYLFVLLGPCVSSQHVLSMHVLGPIAVLEIINVEYSLLLITAFLINFAGSKRCAPFSAKQS